MPDKSLSEGIRELLEEFRRDLGPYGWTIHVERFAGGDLRFEFRNRLSSVSHGIGFDPSQYLASTGDASPKRPRVQIPGPRPGPRPFSYSKLQIFRAW